MLAKDVMTVNVVTVEPDTTVRDIAALLLNRNISAVPVVDPDGGPNGGPNGGPHLPWQLSFDLVQPGGLRTDCRPAL